MGTCCVSNAEDKTRNVDIQQELETAKKQDVEIKKLLLLGSGGSGKSTIFKQLTLIHGSGFDDTQRLAYKSPICVQVIEQMKRLISRSQTWSEKGSSEWSKLQIMSSEATEAAKFMDSVQEDGALNELIVKSIMTLWNDPGIKETFKHRNMFGGFTESTAYFFDHIQRLGKPNYIPTQEDVLFVRYRTTGIIEKDFQINKTKIRLVDVGGQRAERKKWIHCFEFVTAVIYVASLACYDEAMYEQDDENVMIDSIELFGSIINNEVFKNTSIILFLNKSDLFFEKILKVPLTVCFKEYNGNEDNDDEKKQKDALGFIKEKYIQLNQSPDRQIFSHVTCATDQRNIERVFGDVQHILVETSLNVGGLL